ncbi:ATP-binding cassette domain-containing protein [Dyella sp.]|uniref:ATP-binding cassette domain-containing protein n=1 Tax=Dyella sp. TaxID=1869338 RepID=UPI002ED371B1
MTIDIAVRHTLTDGQRRFELDVALRSDRRRIVLYGPSGAGKSITLRAVAGLLRPDAGRIAVNDRLLYDSSAGINIPARYRKAGYLFQDYALFPHLTVAQNVVFGIERGLFNPRRGAAVPAQAQRWLQVFELDNVASSHPARLSGGQRQRVALARALAAAPDVLLLDEPFSALDPALKTRMRRELVTLQAQLNLQMLVITHDPADADALGEHVFEIHEGRVRSQMQATS